MLKPGKCEHAGTGQYNLSGLQNLLKPILLKWGIQIRANTDLDSSIAHVNTWGQYRNLVTDGKWDTLIWSRNALYNGPLYFPISTLIFDLSLTGVIIKWCMASALARSCQYQSGPSCSKLTMSLVNDSLKFRSSDMRICWNFLLKKCE